MQTGLKFYSTNKVTEKDFSFADFIEVLTVPENPVGDFDNFDKKFRIHCPHSEHGFNPCAKNENNTRILKIATDAADKLNADIIVVHSGFNTDKLNIRDAKKNAMEFLTEHFDERLCVENLMPQDSEMKWITYLPEHLTVYRDSGFKFCLDFGHAIETATQLKKNYKDFIQDFLRLKPDYFHLSGTQKGRDMHLSILDSDADVEFMKKAILKAGKPVCLETPLDTGKRKKEVESLKD